MSFGGGILGCFWAEYRTLSSGPDAAVLNMMNMSGGTCCDVGAFDPKLDVHSPPFREEAARSGLWQLDFAIRSILFGVCAGEP